jgi:uracil-DNA glycosylase family 4
MTPDRSKAARDLLAFYVEAGVDAILAEAPTNCFGDDPVPAPAEPTPAKVAAPTPLPSRPPASISVPPPPEEAIMAARAAAKSASSLDELRAIMENFEGCALRQTAKQLVFADGNPQARIMFVGEAPGYDEDIQGLPFVGRSGQLLDKIGLDRSSAYITNIIPWRPPGNRDPSLHETSICLPFIQRHIELVDPDVLVCLGKPSTAALLGIVDGIRKTRGRWFTYNTGTREIRAMPCFHPAYLLRSPLEKRLAWRDLLAIRKALAN